MKQQHANILKDGSGFEPCFEWLILSHNAILFFYPWIQGAILGYLETRAALPFILGTPASYGGDKRRVSLVGLSTPELNRENVGDQENLTFSREWEPLGHQGTSPPQKWIRECGGDQEGCELKQCGIAAQGAKPVTTPALDNEAARCVAHLDDCTHPLHHVLRFDWNHVLYRKKGSPECTINSNMYFIRPLWHLQPFLGAMQVLLPRWTSHDSDTCISRKADSNCKWITRPLVVMHHHSLAPKYVANLQLLPTRLKQGGNSCLRS